MTAPTTKLDGVMMTDEQILELWKPYREFPVDWIVGFARALLSASKPAAPFQSRVQPWMFECFGAEIAADAIERNHRFFEEATEIVQACGMTASEAHQLVDYTFDRPVGEPSQEVGGVMVTLAALCLANGLDMHAAAETELERINVPETVAKIRAKQAEKPKHSPLPAAHSAVVLDDERTAEPRYRVLKASGSRYAYVIDTIEGGSKGRYDVLKGDGWTKAEKHAAALNAAQPASGADQ